MPDELDHLVDGTDPDETVWRRRQNAKKQRPKAIAASIEKGKRTRTEIWDAYVSRGGGGAAAEAIARERGVSVNTVQEHLAKARRDLREAGIEPTRFSSKGRNLAIAPGLPWEIACGRMNVFPGDLVGSLASDLGRRLDVYVPPRECEAALVTFIAGLIERGWEVLRPDNRRQEDQKRRSCS